MLVLIRAACLAVTGREQKAPLLNADVPRILQLVSRNPISMSNRCGCWLTPLGCAARIFPLKRKQMQRMRDTTGRKYTKIKREVISGNPTIQGEWTPTTHKNEKLTYTLEHASSSE